MLFQTWAQSTSVPIWIHLSVNATGLINLADRDELQSDNLVRVAVWYGSEAFATDPSRHCIHDGWQPKFSTIHWPYDGRGVLDWCRGNTGFAESNPNDVCMPWWIWKPPYTKCVWTSPHNVTWSSFLPCAIKAWSKNFNTTVRKVMIK